MKEHTSKESGRDPVEASFPSQPPHTPDSLSALGLVEDRERLLTYLTQNMADILWMMDLSFRTTYVSPSVERILGFTPEERLGQSLEDMVTPESRAEILQRLGAELALESQGAPSDRVLRIDVEYRCKDGSTKWCENVVRPVRGPDGRLVGMLGVSRDISELRAARTRLEASEGRMRELAAYLQAIRERERTDLARDLHDQLGQGLTALGLDLRMLQRVIGQDHSAAQAHLKKTIALVDGLSNDALTLSTELRPGMLDDLGLVPTVEWQISQFEQRSGLRCAFEQDCGEMPLPSTHSTALFRALQELLRNVARHSRASSVEVRLHVSAAVTLVVSDDGRGITPEERTGPRSLGLLGLTEQIRLLGGSVDIAGSPGVGTTVTVSLPLNDETAHGVTRP